MKNQLLIDQCKSIVVGCRRKIKTKNLKIHRSILSRLEWAQRGFLVWESLRASRKSLGRSSLSPAKARRLTQSLYGRSHLIVLKSLLTHSDDTHRDTFTTKIPPSPLTSPDASSLESWETLICIPHLMWIPPPKVYK